MCDGCKAKPKVPCLGSLPAYCSLFKSAFSIFYIVSMCFSFGKSRTQETTCTLRGHKAKGLVVTKNTYSTVYETISKGATTFSQNIKSVCYSSCFLLKSALSRCVVLLANVERAVLLAKSGTANRPISSPAAKTPKSQWGKIQNGNLVGVDHQNFAAIVLLLCRGKCFFSSKVLMVWNKKQRFLEPKTHRAWQ